MKLYKAKVTNFVSYSSLEIDFENQGLTLIYGKTGAGKSTIQDIPMWILFGLTAKDGNSDDIKSWTAFEEPTTGVLELSEPKITITRVRGKPSQNDLYWQEEGSDEQHRGKDLTETQSLINDRLAIDPYTYTIGAYYNEFSPTGSFFTAKASDRRELFESLANLSLPTLLLEKVSNVKKETRKTLIQVSEKLSKEEGRLEQLKRSKASIERDAERWDENQKRTIEDLKVKSQTFEQDKVVRIEAEKLLSYKFELNRQKNIAKYLTDLQKKIDSFREDKACPNCGEIRESDAAEIIELNEHYNHLISKEKNTIDHHQLSINKIISEQNHYEDRILHEQNKSSPFLSQKDTILCDIERSEKEKINLKNQVDKLKYKTDSLTQLQELTDDLRGELLNSTIKIIESDTNKYLEAYFDSEIRVAFELKDGDKLETFIWKSGYECSYKQLSKGQRSLLKLTFSVAVMKAASNKSGIHFDTLMFDESLDGLDSELKLKAFNLFDELSKTHSSVFVIDHFDGLQNLFSKKLYVTIEGDISTIQEV